MFNLIRRILSYPTRRYIASTGFICYRCDGGIPCRDCG